MDDVGLVVFGAGSLLAALSGDGGQLIASPARSSPSPAASPRWPAASRSTPR
jgi:hypothetical protein